MTKDDLLRNWDRYAVNVRYHINSKGTSYTFLDGTELITHASLEGLAWDLLKYATEIYNLIDAPNGKSLKGTLYSIAHLAEVIWSRTTGEHLPDGNTKEWS